MNVKIGKVTENLRKKLVFLVYENYLWNTSEKRIFSLLEEIKLKKDAKIIDVGCATGRTLESFRNHDYFNSIGIDIQKIKMTICMKRCLKINKDVFLMDIKHNKFKSKSFDLVFSEGLLEHFKDMQPIVDEMCRISKKYVLQLQPNYQLSGKMFLLFRNLYFKIFNRPKIYEIHYKIKDYEETFAKANFKLIRVVDLVAKSHWALLFERIR
jgi:ubiquinone/menaquinone biosynthesis C-methylase UbiE